MAEPLKNMYNETFFRLFSEKVLSVYPSFQSDTFLKLIFNEEWDTKELKQRIRHISECLAETLPKGYSNALAILQKLAPTCRGFEYLFFPDFVERYGLHSREESLHALKELTSSSSAEFAIRPFIEAHPEETMALLLKWATNSNEHVRRLASEGCRPRLPWAKPLTTFKKDPSLIIPILQALKEDESEYVRKSVANNLNDIAKDHPAIVKEICLQWRGQHPHTDWILKHGCRTLLRKADPDILELFGFERQPHVLIEALTLSQTSIQRGESLTFIFQLKNETSTPYKLRIEYGIDFVKARGKTSRKLFKITENTYQKGSYSFERNHSFKDLSTRKHHPGEHYIVIIINGDEYARSTIMLT
ncbi:DNA alkylation repair protein [Halalkalibacter sp. APA_J-10(15)]|uniref:DNA alkylation repair protein n=1 Tax=Halalkalibacter sp. APA_J-10(15) TaxID=2933805 RepID=UPI001FF4641C|nr:DNA alkylation repair protein [Halalkalibacter sp. APA_J-10(15)]MCK0472398.1 DNA alkylation repair protein [Halalkalibacter sp. APA_J-10(15)]